MRQAGRTLVGGSRFGRWRLIAFVAASALAVQLCAVPGQASAQLPLRYTVEFTAPTYTQTEGEPAATVTVRRQDALLGLLPLLRRSTVRVRTSDGTARAAEDYTPVDTFVTFNGAETTKTVAIPLLNDNRREPEETINVTLGPEAYGATLGRRRTAVVGIHDDDDRCAPLSAGERRRILDSWLAQLNPEKDDDGDGFTNAQELGPLAFDPGADPTRFNPLIADVPKLEVRENGDMAVALLDAVTDGRELGTVRISEDERKSANVDRRTKSTVETHEVGIGLGAESSEGKSPTGKLDFSYNYTRSTTNERSIEITEEGRRLNREELSRVVKSETQVAGGVLAVTFALKNTGNVAYRIESANLVLRSRLPDGSQAAFATLRPSFAFNQGPTLAPGEEEDVLFEVEDIGARDALALVEDVSELEIDVERGGLELSQIGVGALQAGAGNFAQYQTTIRQNTAEVKIDYGPGASERQLVSTTFLRDGSGRPLGLPLCDAVQILLGRELQLRPPRTVTIGNEERELTTIKAVGRPGPVPTLVESHDGSNKDRYWIINVDPAAVGGKVDYGPADVHLRAAQGAELIYYQDDDLDSVDLRTETDEGTSDLEDDTDRDGLTDGVEINSSFPVAIFDFARKLQRDYLVTTDPTRANPDGDGLNDRQERERTLEPRVPCPAGPGDPPQLCPDPERSVDPGVPDTDGDAITDAEDPWSTPAALSARIFRWRDSPEFSEVDFILSRLDKAIDFNFQENATRSPAPEVPEDKFMIRWTGSVTVPEGGTYFFGGRADDGMRIFVGDAGLSVLDTWDSGPTGSVFDKGVNLQAGQRVPLRAEYFESSGPSAIHLEYRRTSDGEVKPVPQAWLSPDPAVRLQSPRGITAQYYFDANRNGMVDGDEAPLMARVEQRLDWDWTDGSPSWPVVPWDHFIGRWTGLITLPEDLQAGQYEFGAVHDDSLRLSIGDEEVYRSDTFVEAVQWGAAVELEPGEPVRINAELVEKTGAARLQLFVRPVSDRSSSRIVPSEWLSPDPAIGAFQGRTRPAGVVDLKVPVGTGYAAFMRVSGEGVARCDTGDVKVGETKDCDIPFDAFHIEIKVFQVKSPSNPQIDKTIELALPENVCITATGDIDNPKIQVDRGGRC